MRERVYALDFLRALMMFLGVIMHGLEFLRPHLPYISESRSNQFFNFLCQIIHTFRMPAFFCISGYLACVFIKRYGTKGFLENRFKRIFVPFVLSFLFIGFLCLYLLKALDCRYNGLSTLESLSKGFTLAYEKISDVAPLHLWFLYYLFFYVLIISIVNFLWDTLILKHRFRLVHIWKTNYVLAFFIMTSYFVSYFRFGFDFGFDRTSSIRIHPSSFVYNLFFFFLGWIFSKMEFGIPKPKINPFKVLTLAVALTPIVQILDSESLGSMGFLIMILAKNTSLWFYFIGLIGLGMKYFNKESVKMKSVSDSSYWIYLIHFPIILIFHVITFSNHNLVVFAFSMIATICLCWFSYHYFVKKTLIGVLLNGRRRAIDCTKKQMEVQYDSKLITLIRRHTRITVKS